MDLIILLVLIALIGLAVWAITTYVPMPPPFQQLIIGAAVVVIVLYLITRFLHLPNVLP